MSEEWRYDEHSGTFRPTGQGRGEFRGEKKTGSDWVGWAVIALLFLVGVWPVGLIMLINKMVS